MRKIGRRIAAWIAAIAILFAFEVHIPVYAEENGMVRVWLTRFGANPTITFAPTAIITSLICRLDACPPAKARPLPITVAQFP